MAEDKQSEAGITTREFMVLILIFGLGFTFMILGLVHMQGKSANRARRYSCANNLKQMGLVLSMYSNESEGHYYPPMQQKDCNGEQLAWSKALDVAALVPEYIQDPEFVLQCPSNDYSNWDEPSDELMLNPDYSINGPFLNNGTIEHCEMIENSYTYYSHVLLVRGETEYVTEESVVSLQEDFDEIWERVAHGDQLFLEEVFDLSPSSVLLQRTEELRLWRKEMAPESLKMDFSNTQREVRRMKKGVERFFITDIGNPAGAHTSEIRKTFVLMHERIPKNLEFFHPGNGVNVLFLDGHVEFVKNDEAGQFIFGAVDEVVQRRW